MVKPLEVAPRAGIAGLTDAREPSRWTTCFSLGIRCPLPVEAPEIQVTEVLGRFGQLALAIRLVVFAAEELLPRGAVGLGYGSEVELLMGHFLQGAGVACVCGGRQPSLPSEGPETSPTPCPPFLKSPAVKGGCVHCSILAEAELGERQSW